MTTRSKRSIFVSVKEGDCQVTLNLPFPSPALTRTEGFLCNLYKKHKQTPLYLWVILSPPPNHRPLVTSIPGSLFRTKQYLSASKFRNACSHYGNIPPINSPHLMWMTYGFNDFRFCWLPLNTCDKNCWSVLFCNNSNLILYTAKATQVLHTTLLEEHWECSSHQTTTQHHRLHRTQQLPHQTMTFIHIRKNPTTRAKNISKPSGWFLFLLLSPASRFSFHSWSKLHLAVKPLSLWAWCHWH